MGKPAVQELHDPSRATERAGFVTRIEGAVLTVTSSEGELRATRATSCLVAPILGDHVLVAVLGDGRGFVLAVLERTEPGARVELTVDEGDLALRATQGNVEISAKDTVEIVGAKGLRALTARLEITASEGSVAFGKLAMLGRELVAELGRGRVMGQVLESIADTLVSRAQRSARVVTEVDRLKAGVVDYSADKAMHLHGQNALMTATELAKLDGANIHLG